MNGYITCGRSYRSYSPAYFQRSDQLFILAPFWADADGRGQTCRTCNLDSESVVFYNIYENDVQRYGVASKADPEKRVLNSKIQRIISRAQHDAELRSDEFEVSWVLVVTWNKMRPYSWHSTAGEVLNYAV